MKKGLKKTQEFSKETERKGCKMNRRIFVSLLLAVTALVVSRTIPAEQYEIDPNNIVTVINTTDFIAQPRWDPSGQILAWLQLPALADDAFELWVSDLTKPGNEVLLVQDTELIRNSPIAWSPNGQFILYTHRKLQADPLLDRPSLGRASALTPDTVTDDFLRPSDFSDFSYTNDCWDVRDPSIALTTTGYKLIVSITSWCDFLVHSEGVFSMEIDDSGVPNLSTVTKILGSNNLFINPVLSPDGNTLLVEQPWTSTSRKLWLIEGIEAVISGSDQPVEDFDTDSRVHLLNPELTPTGSHFYATNPQSSQDGTLIYFDKDVTGTFDETDILGTIQGADFDVVVCNRADVVAGNPNPNVLASPDHQSALHSSGGGTRFAYTHIDLVTGVNLNLGTLKISTTVLVDQNGFAQEAIVFEDGSGMKLIIPAGTQLQNVTIPLDGLITISVYTPINPFVELSLAGISGVKLYRFFEPEGITFVPPSGSSVILILHYTDAEVEGLDEDTLGVFKISDSLTITVTIIARDPAKNLITLEITGFSMYVLSGPMIQPAPATSWLGQLILILGLLILALTRLPKKIRQSTH